MTPQERQLVTDLFERLASLENSPRDAEAERLIADGLARAPHALYPLVQTVLLQDEALRRASTRIRELEGNDAPHESPGFLDSMRDAFFGRDEGRRGSVPSVPPASKWGSGQTLSAPYGTQQQQPGFPQQQNIPQQEPQRGGGSFLGTAAAAAAGVIGGSLLLNSIQSMMGGQGGQAFGAPQGGADKQNPWGGDEASRSDMARDAGANDIGGGRGGDRGQSQGLFDNNKDGGNDSNGDDGDFDIADAGDFDGGDFGGDGGGGD
jgi:hypothetical protein